MKKTISLYNHHEMPMVGLGTYKSPPGKLQQAVKDAIDVGYRHFDCAWIYDNEDEIGKAIRSKIDDGTVNRGDLFVTSKLWNNFHAKDKVVPKLQETLSALELSYVDLYLIHWPLGFHENAPLLPTDEGPEAYSDIDYLETWQGMEDCVELGLAKSIGLSNFNSQQIDRLLKVARIRPAVNHIECNPNINQRRLIGFCRDRGIAVTGYCPLGRSERVGTPGFPTPAILDPKVVDIGEKYNKSPAQVVLNYLISLGVSVVPKSVTKSRIIDNINVFDFVLDDDDIRYLDSCDRNQRISPFKDFKDHEHYPFNIDY